MVDHDRATCFVARRVPCPVLTALPRRCSRLPSSPSFAPCPLLQIAKEQADSFSSGPTRSVCTFAVSIRSIGTTPPRRCINARTSLRCMVTNPVRQGLNTRENPRRITTKAIATKPSQNGTTTNQQSGITTRSTAPSTVCLHPITFRKTMAFGVGNRGRNLTSEQADKPDNPRHARGKSRQRNSGTCRVFRLSRQYIVIR